MVELGYWYDLVYFSKHDGMSLEDTIKKAQEHAKRWNDEISEEKLSAIKEEITELWKR